MFSALNQGSTIYILDKTDGFKYKVGTVTSISAPRTNYNASLNVQNPTVIDIKCQVDGINQEYNSVPSTYTQVSYNNGKIIISETQQGIQSEVEGILQSSKAIVDNIDTYTNNITCCENILKQLNPQYAKDQEMSTRLDCLEHKIQTLIDMMDKVKAGS